MRQEQQAEERILILEYETFRQELARQVWNDLSEDKRRNLSKQKLELLREQERFKRLARRRPAAGSGGADSAGSGEDGSSAVRPLASALPCAAGDPAVYE